MPERISIAVLKDLYRYSVPEESHVNKKWVASYLRELMVEYGGTS